METMIHTMNALFKQLGLDSSDSDIDAFIRKVGPIKQDLELHKAECWSASQSDLLREMREDDADWAEIIDQLDARLR